MKRSLRRRNPDRPYGALLLAAYQGRTAEASTLIEATVNGAVAGVEGLGIQLARWTTAILGNVQGRHAEALAAAQQASDETPVPFISAWALPELIEAGRRRLGAGDRGALTGAAE